MVDCAVAPREFLGKLLDRTCNGRGRSLRVVLLLVARAARGGVDEAIEVVEVLVGVLVEDEGVGTTLERMLDDDCTV